MKKIRPNQKLGSTSGDVPMPVLRAHDLPRLLKLQRKVEWAEPDVQADAHDCHFSGGWGARQPSPPKAGMPELRGI